MLTTAQEIANAVATPVGEHALTREDRVAIARQFMLEELVPYMGRRTMFEIALPGLPFIRRKVSWAWLGRVLVLAFDRAVTDMRPVTITTEHPEEHTS